MATQRGRSSRATFAPAKRLASGRIEICGPSFSTAEKAREFSRTIKTRTKLVIVRRVESGWSLV